MRGDELTPRPSPPSPPATDFPDDDFTFVVDNRVYNRAHMKRVHFIAVAMCLLVSVAHATPSLADRADSPSRSRDHAAAVERYRKAYELDNNPIYLVRMAHAYRLAGDLQQALAYFCSYMYVDAAGGLADEASMNARALAAQLGNPTESDHQACTTKPGSNAAKPAPRLTVDMLSDVLPQKPPRITKREVVGLVMLGGSVASLGLALLEGQQVKQLREKQDLNVPGTDLDALADRERSADLRQKLYLGAGGVTLITGGILYVLGRADRKRAERAYVAPSLTKNGSGLVLGGSF
jgi:tetratricopeptide (TPR) repeat protein